SAFRGFHRVSSLAAEQSMHEYRLDRQLGGGECERLPGERLVDAIHFVEHLARHDLGDVVLRVPLPLPMRTSAGFCDTGLSGKMRIQILPPRLMWRVIARRAASIWRAVSRPRAAAFRPYS